MGQARRRAVKRGVRIAEGGEGGVGDVDCKGVVGRFVTDEEGDGFVEGCVREGGFDGGVDCERVVDGGVGGGGLEEDDIVEACGML